jgi:hypothetical protein
MPRPYILPERYSVPFTDAAEEEEARPKAILFLKFVGAKNVPKMDLFSQSDPYVRSLSRLPKPTNLPTFLGHDPYARSLSPFQNRIPPRSLIIPPTFSRFRHYNS